MSIPRKCDVVVVGGGPAGSLAATALADGGYDVVLFDKQRHPRYHVGESLLPDFWKHADAAGVSDRIESEGFVRKSGGVVSWDGQVKAVAFNSFGYDRPGLHVERDTFDHILLDNARKRGVQVFEEVAVVSADPGDRVVSTVRRVAGEETFTVDSSYIVDASGQNALMGRQLGIREVDEAFRYMSVWGYFRNSRYLNLEGRLHPSADREVVSPTTFISSVGGTGKVGWLWHILQREATSVGLVIPVELAKRVREEHGSWEAYFLRTCLETPIASVLLENAEFIDGSLRVINDYSFRSRQLAGPGFFLVGDAAGFTDPIFSVGVVLAMYSGRIAAWAIDRSFRNPASAERNRSLFADQLEGRIEMARSLALPSDRPPDEVVSDTARRALRLEPSAIQRLMHAASSLTTRSKNFLDMKRSETAELEAEQLVRLLPELEGHPLA